MIALPYIGHAAAAKELTGRPCNAVDRLQPRWTVLPGRTVLDGAVQRSASRLPASRWALYARQEPVGGLAGRGNPLQGLPMRVTYRTLRVLTVIAEHGGQGHIRPTARSPTGRASPTRPRSHADLRRLQDLGLIEQLGRGPTQGKPNAWSLTPWGNEVQRELEASSGG